MPVLTTLTQFEQEDLENEVIDAVGCQRGTARKIVAEVLVPALEERTRGRGARALRAAAGDATRMHRIHTTPQVDVTPEDTAWMTAPGQRLLHGLPSHMPFRNQLVDVAAWLGGLADRNPS